VRDFTVPKSVLSHLLKSTQSLDDPVLAMEIDVVRIFYLTVCSRVSEFLVFLIAVIYKYPE